MESFESKPFQSRNNQPAQPQRFLFVPKPELSPNDSDCDSLDLDRGVIRPYNKVLRWQKHEQYEV